MVRKFASSATGAGIGRNIVDCYEAILKHYEPGDRIYLCGFSRGAYTARCVAGVLRYCGVPTRTPKANYLPKFGSDLRAIAEEAVHVVYEHGSGRDRSRFEPQRQELARRFREKYGSDVDRKANAVPYFIGVFDTVAALGASGLRRWIMLIALAAAAAGLVTATAFVVQLLGPSFWRAFAWVGIGSLVFAAIMVARARLKVIWNYPRKGQFRWHWSGWRFTFYDTNLDPQVPFARHALAIDETRADFARVKWGQPSEGEAAKTEGVPERFQQTWFAGNHSDIGGSYPEDESRLSDIALGWMVDVVTSLPQPVKVDRAKLNLYPSSRGMQHCEVVSFLDKYPKWWPQRLRFGWRTKLRRAAIGAPHHPSVLERFKLDAVVQCTTVGPYRPRVLEDDDRYREFYNHE